MHSLDKYLLVFAFSFFLFSCQQNGKHEAESGDSTTSIVDTLSAGKVGISCEAAPDQKQLKLLNSILSDIKATVDNMEYCPSVPYKPAPCPAQDIGPECKMIFEDLSDYLKDNFGKMKFCVINTSEWYAAVNVNESQPRIFVSTRFFRLEDYEEQKRSLVHELNHLQGNFLPHTGNKKQCAYFQNDALKSEYCMTCGVSFTPIVQLSCSTGEDGFFMITK